jgi:hypothetical protein
MGLTERLEFIFTPTVIEAADPRCEVIRESCLYAARLVVASTPKCADQTHAIRLIRQAMRTAQDAVLLKGEV